MSEPAELLTHEERVLAEVVARMKGFNTVDDYLRAKVRRSLQRDAKALELIPTKRRGQPES